jgi:hypothetical protein
MGIKITDNRIFKKIWLFGYGYSVTDFFFRVQLFP